MKLFGKISISMHYFNPGEGGDHEFSDPWYSRQEWKEDMKFKIEDLFFRGGNIWLGYWSEDGRFLWCREVQYQFRHGDILVLHWWTMDIIWEFEPIRPGEPDVTTIKVKQVGRWKPLSLGGFLPKLLKGYEGNGKN